MIETYRMLGREREEELLREARRLRPPGSATRSHLRAPIRGLERLVTGVGTLLVRLRGRLPRTV